MAFLPMRQRRMFYSAATGSTSGSNGSVASLAPSTGSIDVEVFSRRRSTIRSRKHSTGTEYFRSADEYFVRNEMTMLSPSAEWLSALNATTLTGMDRFCSCITYHSHLLPCRFFDQAIQGDQDFDLAQSCAAVFSRSHLIKVFGQEFPYAFHKVLTAGRSFELHYLHLRFPHR